MEHFSRFSPSVTVAMSSDVGHRPSSDDIPTPPVLDWTDVSEHTQHSLDGAVTRGDLDGIGKPVSLVRHDDADVSKPSSPQDLGPGG